MQVLMNWCFSNLHSRKMNTTDWLKILLPKFLMNKTVSLSEIGGSELAFTYDDIVKVIQIVSDKELIILGGDVLRRKNVTLMCKYDNWYYQELKYNKDSINKSKKMAEAFINSYVGKNGREYLFVIVLQAL